MPYAATDRKMEVIANLLPRTAMTTFVDAANGEEARGGGWNECISAGWAEVNKRYHRPAGKGRYVRKDEPGAGDVHVDAPLGSESDKNRKKRPKIMADDGTISMSADIVKVGDDESRMAFGWASVISEDGKPYIDSQDHVISPDELVKATTDFMADARVAKAMHEGGQIGEVLHSLPLTAELAKSLGIESNREGWIVGVKVHDDGIWKDVKAGTLRAFSIGGTAQLEQAA